MPRTSSFNSEMRECKYSSVGRKKEARHSSLTARASGNSGVSSLPSFGAKLSTDSLPNPSPTSTLVATSCLSKKVLNTMMKLAFCRLWEKPDE